MESIAGIYHRDLREVAGVHDLRQQLEGRRNHGLGGHDTGKDRENERWIKHAGRNGLEEWVGIGGRVVRDIRSLADISEKEAGIYEDQPRNADGTGRELGVSSRKRVVTMDGKWSASEML
jgi:hypothetical protein